MRIIKYILLYFFVFILLLLFFYSDNKVTKELISEEAIPIRENEEIKGMYYTITLDNKLNDNNVDINSLILSSIYHYKDVNNIDHFYINLKIDNKSNNNYLIDDIEIIDKSNNKVIRSINYKSNDNLITFDLGKEDFVNYSTNYDISIKLRKNTRFL